MAYPDIFRKVKSDPELMDLGEEISRITKSPGKTTENFLCKVPRLQRLKYELGSKRW